MDHKAVSGGISIFLVLKNRPNSETFFPTKKDPKKWAEGHAVKGRSEPCHIVQVAEVVAKVKQIEVSEVAEAAWENTIKLFRLDL